MFKLWRDKELSGARETSEPVVISETPDNDSRSNLYYFHQSLPSRFYYSSLLQEAVLLVSNFFAVRKWEFYLRFLRFGRHGQHGTGLLS